MAKSLGGFGHDIAYYASHKVAIIEREARVHPRRIIEYGCGTGRNLKFLRKAFPEAEVCGCDVSEKSIESAAKANPDCRVFVSSEMDAVTDAGGFDLAFVANVFHHITPGERECATRELLGLVAPGGEIFVFEHNPFNPLTRRVVATCAFDEDAVLLKPGEMANLLAGADVDVLATRFTLFFPASLRLFAGVERFVGRLPLGGQYYVHAQKTA
jgi:trans-aconitate methyltransferase